MIKALEGDVIPKGLKFTVLTKFRGEEIEQDAELSDNHWGVIQKGSKGNYDFFFGLCEVIEVFDNEHPTKGWFIARVVKK